MAAVGMNMVCAKCEEYKQDQVGFEVADSGSIVCDECYDQFIKESYAAREAFQREWESGYMARFFAAKQQEIDAQREASWYDTYE